MPKAGIGEKIENNFCQSLQKSRREGKVEESNAILKRFALHGNNKRMVAKRFVETPQG